MSNVCGRSLAAGPVEVQAEVAGGPWTSCLSCAGVPGVLGGGIRLRLGKKGCGGQLVVLRGGTGGRGASRGEVEEDAGKGGHFTTTLLLNFVLSLGTGLSLSTSVSP